jgi:hypothetical protein
MFVAIGSIAFHGGRAGLSRRRITAALAGAALTLALTPSGAAAGPSPEPEIVPGAGAPGPPEYDQVYVSKFGPSDAGRVLVLMPGTSGGAGDFTLLAEDLVAAAPELNPLLQEMGGFLDGAG